MDLPEQDLDRLGLCYAGYENAVNNRALVA